MFDDIIFLLLKKGAHRDPVRATTRQLAAELGISQQSFSRRSLILISEGYIERQGGAYILTNKALSEAKTIYRTLSEALFGGKSLEFTGKIVHGISQGEKFMKMHDYRRQFIKLLGFDPYPGTLNVTIPPEDIELRLRLKSKKPILIEGFKRGRRTYGSIIAYPALIEDTIRGAVIFPDRSTHGLTIMELIAPINIKQKLRLEDGDQITFRVDYGDD
ncbi:MAG: DUF120 domain-containing protein [Candidatus Anstonellales archaeon]